MSKKPKTTVSNFKFTAEGGLPTLGKVRTNWDLKKLFYTSPDDPTMEVDVARSEKLHTKFARTYKKGDFVVTNASLLKSLHDYRKLHDTNIDKVFIYLFLCQEKDATDTRADQVLSILTQRVQKFSNLVIFYTLEIGKITPKRQKEILKNADFAEFRFLLQGIFENAKFNLSEPEEKILALKSLTSRTLWISGTDKIVNTASVTVGKETMPLNGVLMEFPDAPKVRRHILWSACKTKLKEIGPLAENELNAIITDKKINDELRGYKKPYSSTVRSFDTTEKSLEALTQAVVTEGYRISRKFYSIKAKLNGKKLDYIDRDDFPKRLPALPFDSAVLLCREAFHNFNPLYGKIFDDMITGGHIDVYPRSGKGGGAFCIGSTNTPTCVMLNHTDDFGSARTLAHEMGHAVHAYRSKEQSVLYDNHSTVTAETASTFFEAVLSETIISKLSDDQKVIYLNTIISEKIATMIMCIARYRAELEIHETIRTNGTMTWQDMSAVLAKHFQEYCGPGINVENDDGLSVIVKTHYRRNFYQFTYSFGVIASTLMFQKYQDDASYSKQVETFLSAGEKDTVESIFKEIGINTNKPETFLKAMQALEDDVKEFEKLLKKQK